jgi:hypothetical protein
MKREERELDRRLTEQKAAERELLSPTSVFPELPAKTS